MASKYLRKAQTNFLKGNSYDEAARYEMWQSMFLDEKTIPSYF